MKPLDAFAIHLNNFRVIPRMVMLWLLYTTWQLVGWAMHLTRPISADDVALVGLFTGLFVAAFKFYVDTGSFNPTTEEKQNGQLSSTSP